MKYLISLIIISSIAFNTTFAQKAEVVFGKIVLKSTKNSRPLTSAKVLLCNKTDTISGFTDNDGNIAFYNVKVNNYVLKTILNADTLMVVMPNNQKTKQKPIKIVAGTNDIGTINVRRKD